MKMKLSETLDKILRIIVWGAVGFIVLVLILKSVGVIHSPEYIIETLVGIILADLFRLEGVMKEMKIKLNMLWSEFKKRKKI